MVDASYHLWLIEASTLARRLRAEPSRAEPSRAEDGSTRSANASSSLGEHEPLPLVVEPAAREAHPRDGQ
jgi:hypothetical protein